MSVRLRSCLSCGVVSLSVLLLSSASCSPTPSDRGERAALHGESEGAIAAFKATDPTLNALMTKAVAWVVFPDVGKAAFVVGGAHGRGVVYHGGRRVGYSSISQGSLGLQVGAQTFRQLALFLREEDFQRFKRGDFSLEANASAVLLKAGAASTTDISKGVIVFVEPKGGLMAEAAIAGQVLKYEAH